MPHAMTSVLFLCFRERDWGTAEEAKAARDARARDLRKVGYKVTASGGPNPFGGPSVYFLKGVRRDHEGPVVFSSASTPAGGWDRVLPRTTTTKKEA